MTLWKPQLEFLAAVLAMWLVHLAPALVVSIPAMILGRSRVHWRRSDVFAFVIPWLAWFVVFGFGPRDASLASAVCESVLVGCAVGVGFILVVMFAPGRNAISLRRGVLLGVAAFSLMLWAVFPFLGE